MLPVGIGATMAMRGLTVLGLLLIGACGESATAPPPPPPAEPSLPITGTAVPGMASFDRIIPELTKKWGIPGATVALVRDGRLVFARGYGYADQTTTPVQPDALFRIASVSKPITAAAILKLREEGRLDLDAKAFTILNDLTPPAGTAVDPRVREITIRQLLHHSGGWDRDATFDPMFRSTAIAQAMGTGAPASAETIIRYMLGRQLDFDPGTRYVYSNFGYTVLGRIIEKVTGEGYEEYTRRAILAPAGISRMRIGRSLYTDRAPGEVQYFDLATAPSVFPGGGTVQFPYGGYYHEAMGSNGGWVASGVDLLRFLTAVDGLPTRPDLLRPATIELMIAPPPAPLWQGSSYHYGMGWSVRPNQGNWWHNGSLPGNLTLLARTGNGLAWAVQFNSRTMVPGTNWTTLLSEADAAIWQAVGQVTEWPTHDLFSRYP